MLSYKYKHTELNSDLIKKVGDQFKTPFYLYDSEAIKVQYESLSKSLGGYADIFYSIKANPNVSICNLLKNLGAGAEICSEYEFYAALKAGFNPKNIIFVGPAKSDEVIRLCLTHEIYAIVCESLSEYARIAKLAKELNIKANVALRINPDFMSKSALLQMGGKASQFGIDEKIVFDNVEYITKFKNIQLIGIHVYNGTRILDAETLYQNTKAILELARKFSNIFKINIQMVDIGGGIGVPYHENETFFNLQEFNELCLPEFEKFKIDNPSARIILESGRFLVALAGVFVSRVIDVKMSKGEKYVVTDGGTNCHMAAVGIGSLFKRNFPIRLISHQESTKSDVNSKYNITGPLCTPGDLIGKDVLLGEVKEGDLIVVDRSGAYGPTASPTLFLSHGFPAEILLDKEKIFIIRTPDSSEDLFKNQIIFNQNK